MDTRTKEDEGERESAKKRDSARKHILPVYPSTSFVN